MTTTHLILRYAHISMGLTALVAGTASMTFRKGSPLHRQAGNAFFASMLIMAGAGAFISIFLTPVAANIMGGFMALYLTGTAWLTVWRKPGETGYAEVAAMLFGVVTTVAGVKFGMQAAASSDGRLHAFPAMGYYIFASAAALGTLLDLRMLARGGFTGNARTTRHLTRMCFAFFMATGSFFLGQAKVFPPEVRQSGLLPIPALMPLALMIYWLIRIRVWPRLRGARSRQGAAVGARLTTT
jgi:hypothetical protein